MPKRKGSKLNRETGKYEMPASSLLERAESAVITERAKAREPERGEAAAERSIGRYDFEGGAFVRISASSSLDIQTVLEMVDTLVNLKRKIKISLLERAESAVTGRAKAREPERGEAAESSISRTISKAALS